MNIKEQLMADMKEAMKAKDKASLATIRMMIDRIQKNEKEVMREAQPDEVIRIIQTFKKQTEEELADFTKVGNQDKIKELKANLELIKKYLPEMMSREQVKEELANVLHSVQKVGNVAKGDFIKLAMNCLKSRAENKTISEVVNELFK